MASSAGEAAPVVLPATAKLYECTVCHCTFRRLEHLTRHSILHTGEKQHRCPCGSAFSRNDVLVRHLRGCAVGQKGQQKQPNHILTKRARAKRACDRCAKLKMKCDYQDPCCRCFQKLFQCEYTRDGRLDPHTSDSTRNSALSAPAADRTDQSNVEYLENQAQKSDSTDVFDVAPTSSTYWPSNVLEFDFQEDQPQLEDEFADTSLNKDFRFSTCQSLLDQTGTYGLGLSPDSDFPEEDQSHMQLEFSDKSFSTASEISNSQSFLTQNGIGDLSPNSEPMILDFTSLFATSSKAKSPFDGLGHYDLVSASQAISSIDIESFSFPIHQFVRSASQGGFQPEQIDPIRAKCLEMQSLLRNSAPLVTDDIISSFMTRENVILFTELFGKHFQHNFPVLHSPTFNLMQTSPILLLAILSCGACYSDGLVPMGHILKLSMRLQILIENEPHEINMQVPALSTITASVIICCILGCSSDSVARKFVPTYFSRNISMAKRAGLFDPVDSVDYNTMTEETFDWQLWIEQESRRRIAFGIFCHDMSGCVFEGFFPSFSPLDFNLALPCYEVCWQAKTALECLQGLQTMPQQISVPSAVRLMLTSTENSQLFEASGFGMFILIKSLHCILFQATHYDLELSFDMANTKSCDFFISTGINSTEIVSRLQQDLSGSNVAMLADAVVKSFGSPTLKRVNSALNTWRTILDLRQYREDQYENRTFVHEPLPFWWLAKLLLLLHYSGNMLGEDSEFSNPRAKCVRGKEDKRYEVKIGEWFQNFRGQKKKTMLLSMTSLSSFMKPVNID